MLCPHLPSKFSLCSASAGTLAGGAQPDLWAKPLPPNPSSKTIGVLLNHQALKSRDIWNLLPSLLQKWKRMETHTSVEFRLHEPQLPRGWRVQRDLAHAAGACIEEGAGWRSIFLLSASDVKAILAPRPVPEKALAPRSSALAWRIPWTEEPGGLWSMGSLRVRHDWATSLSLFTFMHWRRKWHPLQCSCLEHPRDGGAWWAAVYGVSKSQTQLSDFHFDFQVSSQVSRREKHVPNVAQRAKFCFQRRGSDHVLLSWDVASSGHFMSRVLCCFFQCAPAVFDLTWHR